MGDSILARLNASILEYNKEMLLPKLANYYDSDFINFNFSFLLQ